MEFCQKLICKMKKDTRGSNAEPFPCSGHALSTSLFLMTSHFIIGYSSADSRNLVVSDFPFFNRPPSELRGALGKYVLRPNLRYIDVCEFVLVSFSSCFWLNSTIWSQPWWLEV